MFSVNLNLIKRLVFTLSLILIVNLGFAQGPTDCGCDDSAGPPLSPQWFECVEECQNLDIPVNGNIWILAVAGLVLFAAKDKIFRKS